LGKDPATEEGQGSEHVPLELQLMTAFADDQGQRGHVIHVIHQIHIIYSLKKELIEWVVPGALRLPKRMP
jgi:hypothetical protein